MASARVLSVNVGVARDMMIGRTAGRSAIDKRPAAGRVLAGWLGLAGDQQADTASHGGRDLALYGYAREDLDWWTERLGRELRNGEFGENLTTAGLDVTGALIGETWRLGGAVVQVTFPRIPCATFQSWTGEPHWVKRFADVGRPGAYLRVLAEGEIWAGAPAQVLARPDVRVTVAEALRAYYGDERLMRLLLTVPGRAAVCDEVAVQVLGRAG